jgi:type I restriction enzyme, S subunit
MGQSVKSSNPCQSVIQTSSRYKQTEVGVIPEDWDVARLGDLFEITSSKRVFRSQWKTEGVPFYRAREIAVLGERGFIDNDLFISRQMYDAFRRAYGVPQIGDALVTGVGTLGRVYVVHDDHEFYFKDGNIIWFKIAGAVCPAYLRQLYLTPGVIKQITDAAAGTTVGTYTISGAKNTLIPLPNKSEQEAIAAALSDVDALITSLDTLIAKKRDIKQAAMQQLLTGKTRLPNLSGEWEVLNMTAHSTLKARIGWQGLTTAEYLDSGEYYLVTGTDFDDGEIDWHGCHFVDKKRYDQDKKIQLRLSDVLVTKDGTIGKLAYVHTLPGHATLNSGVFVVRPKDNKYHPHYLYYVLASSIFAGFLKQLQAGSTISHLYQRDFVGFSFSAPPFPEQRAIAAVLSDMDAEIAALERRRDKTRALKQGMMQELLTGRTRLV